MNSTTLQKEKWTMAGKLATGEPVFYEKKDHDDAESDDLTFWVTLSTKKGIYKDARLQTLGIDEEMRFDSRYDEYPDGATARAACRERWNALVTSHLATLTKSQFTAAIS
jgi:hypothetical protein